MGIPKQRGPGQRGGSGGHRANRGTFRNSGGNVKPPGKGCTIWAIGFITAMFGTGYLITNWIV